VTESDRAAQSILRTLALVALGFWALTTAIYGIGGFVNAIQNVRDFRAFAHDSEGSQTFSAPLFGLGLLAGLAWMLGTVSGAAGVLLGAIQIGLAKRGFLLCAGFTVLGIGGVIAAFVTDQLWVNSESPQINYLSWSVLGDLLLPLIALLVFIGAWAAVRPPDEVGTALSPG